MKRLLLILAATAALIGGSLVAPDTAAARNGWGWGNRGPSFSYRYGRGYPYARYYRSAPYRYDYGYRGYPRRSYYNYPYRSNYGPSIYLSSPRGGIYYRY